MGNDRSGYTSGHVRGWNVRKWKENNVLDEEAWGKLCEYGIDSPIFWYKVVRLRRKGEMLGLLESDVKVMPSRKKSGDTHRSVGYTPKSRLGSGKLMLIHQVPAAPGER
jgi:hypothetical protein